MEPTFNAEDQSGFASFEESSIPNETRKKLHPKNDSRNGKRQDHGYLDVIREKPIRVTVKVLVPVKEHPKFNFVGKLLGPKGNSMKRLQEQTMTKMAVLGRGSMRDRAKEEDLRASGDPKYVHLAEDLHVEVAAYASPAEAHARIAYALAEIRRYLVPDNNDDIRKEQIREMERISDHTDLQNENGADARSSSSPTNGTSTSSERPSAPLTPPAEMVSTGNSSECCIPFPHVVGSRRGVAHSPILSFPRTCPPMIRKMPPQPLYSQPPSKRRVLSILDKAKLALDHSYGVHEDYDQSEYMYEDYPEYGPEDYQEIYPTDSYGR